jgi:hypothetical protein
MTPRPARKNHVDSRDLLGLKKGSVMIVKAALVLALFVLNGCASQGWIKEDARKSISGIAIDKNVKLPERIFYYGPEQAIGAGIGGIIGGLIAAGADDEPAKISAYMRRNRIDVAVLIADELEAAVSQTARLPWPLRDAPDAILRMNVVSYGLMHKMAFSSEYKPLLTLQLQLVDTGGAVMWQDVAHATNLTSQTPGYTYEQYFSVPENMTMAYSEAAKFVVNELLNKLQRSEGSD